ncbi:MAG: hypothetical protein PHQ34_07545 [Methanothrix sp.]|nr:hypothetical protein [Methanothrix sp.]
MRTPGSSRAVFFAALVPAVARWPLPVGRAVRGCGDVVRAGGTV